MAKLTLECVTHKRCKQLTSLLISLHNQTFQDWDLVILEEYGNNYISDRDFASVLRMISNDHRVEYLRPSKHLGCGKSLCVAMSRSRTKYGMKLDDDHILDRFALEKLVKAMDSNKNIGSIGGMIPPVGLKLVKYDEIPSDFNKWTLRNGLMWNDYSILPIRFPEKIVRVDFLRGCLIYNAELLRDSGFIEEYPTLGYSNIAFRIESEISNTLESKYNVKTYMHTGVFLYHFLASGGTRSYDYGELLANDSKIYYSRWGELHKQRSLELREIEESSID